MGPIRSRTASARTTPTSPASRASPAVPRSACRWARCRMDFRPACSSSARRARTCACSSSPRSAPRRSTRRRAIRSEAERTLEPIPLEGADVGYDAGAFASRADVLFEALHREIPWEQHRLRIFGRDVDSPRLSCWIGDEGTAYRYSGTRFEPRAWTPTLASVRDELATRYALGFNSVLANLYRDGRDSMGWHSDDEPELGPEPAIASLTFGASRGFRFRSRQTEKV